MPLRRFLFCEPSRVGRASPCKDGEDRRNCRSKSLDPKVLLNCRKMIYNYRTGCSGKRVELIGTCMAESVGRQGSNWAREPLRGLRFPKWPRLVSPGLVRNRFCVGGLGNGQPQTNLSVEGQGPRPLAAFRATRVRVGRPRKAARWSVCSPLLTVGTSCGTRGQREP